MCKICPKCGAIAEYNAYYGRTTCTRCSWESEKSKTVSQREFLMRSLKAARPTKQVKVTMN